MISLNGVTKKYGSRVILDNIDLEVKKGEFIALVGENGVGKSTLLRIMAGLIPVTSGEICTKDGISSAFIPDRYDKTNFKIKQFMKHMLNIEAINYGESCIQDLYDKFFLNDMLETPMKFLSKGTLQKVAVIQAMIKKRDVIFMDEPLSGQDYISQNNFVMAMKQFKREGLSVVMSCHEPFLIQELADKILLLRDGKLAEGSLYIYGKQTRKALFILEKSDCISSLDEKTAGKSAVINKQGQIIKITVDKDYCKGVLQWIIESNVHMIKYEEVEN